LVPDGDAQLTSDHGFDLRQDSERLLSIITQLKSWGCRVSVFMDPDPEQMAMAAAIGADRVELYTEAYAVAHAQGDFTSTLSAFVDTAIAADEAGLGVNAGHDLNLVNLPDFKIPYLLEVSIGHALTVDALRYGFAASVAHYQKALALRACSD
jgi:pyridoxine 5-phosphate synthase